MRATSENPPRFSLQRSHVSKRKKSWGPPKLNGFTLSVDYETEKTHGKVEFGHNGGVVGCKGLKPWDCVEIWRVSWSFGWTQMHTNTTTIDTHPPAPCVPDRYPHRAPDIMSVLRMSTPWKTSCWMLLLISINLTLKLSHSWLKKWYTMFSRSTQFERFFS